MVCELGAVTVPCAISAFKVAGIQQPRSKTTGDPTQGKQFANGYVLWSLAHAGLEELVKADRPNNIHERQVWTFGETALAADLVRSSKSLCIPVGLC